MLEKEESCNVGHLTTLEILLFKSIMELGQKTGDEDLALTLVVWNWDWKV